MATVEKIKELVKEFETLQTKYSSFGACDSEPNWVFEKVIVYACDGKPFDGCIGSYGWQLYSSKTGVKKVEKELTTKAKKVYNAISKSPVMVAKEIRRYYIGE